MAHPETATVADPATDAAAKAMWDWGERVSLSPGDPMRRSTRHWDDLHPDLQQLYRECAEVAIAAYKAVGNVS